MSTAASPRSVGICQWQGGLYCGGSAKMVEKALGVEGDDILYVGDHIYTDAGQLPLDLFCRHMLCPCRWQMRQAHMSFSVQFSD